ncbi:hypothetical protein SASPL_128838 [Salvia splendens]|uniref:Uncharacterized protein n=2 Tax=Salvia splendens TaxID=180675 RepID=A0A8X8XC21_SALSN|nr:uncharacterized protein LOC121751551 isoform X2 [Salvia splendens]KAG6410770.1 hypothetical protein SASPL_128838 [Salvia splendens]
MQSSVYIRRLASGRARKQGGEPEAAKMGMLKKFTRGLGHSLYPIGIIGGCVVLAIMIAGHTGMQHFVRSPIVHVTKKNRGSMPEVDNPDAYIRAGDNFVNKSFLRKVGHLQETQYGESGGANIYTRSRESDTLRTVGVVEKK